MKKLISICFALSAIIICNSQIFNVNDTVIVDNSGKLIFKSFPKFESVNYELKINEFCARNESIIHDEYGEYDDWIEIYNFGDDTIDLNGVYITDDLSNIQKWQFSEEIIILPDSFVLVWADNEPEQGINHIGFKLSGDGEEIGLFTPDSLFIIDSVVFSEQISDISMGRIPDGGIIWNCFENPTPGSSNSSTGMYGITPTPEFSVIGGFYSSNFYITIDVDLDSAQIYYTTDNSTPTTSSIEYSDSILINSTTVIRARAFKEDFIPGYTATETFIFNYDFTLDAISLVTDDNNLWGPSGIYDNPYSGVEKPIHFEYFNSDENQVLKLDCGVKLHAPDYTRDQKSLRLYARSEYGEKEFNYSFFDELNFSTFKRLILRNGGNDGMEDGKTQIRDPLSHIMYKHCNPENGISSYKPVHIFLNGDYWGIYNLRERQDEYYIKSNFGEENIDFLEYDAHSPDGMNAITGNWQNFDSLKNYVIENDLSDSNYYQVVKNWMDIENFVDYQIYEIFIGNQDWLSNNIRFWRPKRTDEKWKWVLWDTEYGLALFYPNYNIGYPDFNFLHMAMTWGGWGSEDYTYLLRNLTDNSEFLKYFNIRFADLLNTELRENGYIVDVIDSLQNILNPDVQFQFNRWGSNTSIWNIRIQEIKDFTNGRPYYIREHIINEYNLNTTTFNLSIDVQPPNSGQIQVNTVRVSDFPWDGEYFTDYITEITAIPNQGFVFEGWEGIASNNQSLLFNTLSDTSFTALFTKNPVDSAIVINEINYNSADFFDTDDWVELKNISGSPVNLSQWIFKDGNDEHIFEIPEGIIVESNSYLVLCNDTVLFKLFYPNITNYVGNLNFGFSGNNEVLRLYDYNNQLVDSVHYFDSIPWTNLADGYGPTLELKNDSLNNDIPGSWRASFVIGGTPGETNSIQAPVQLFINEFMADNDITITDPQGEYDDWIELYNNGEQYVNIGGMFITDDLNEPVEWQIPDNSPDSTIILPGEFLLLWADKDSDDGILHLEIKLSASGEQIGVYKEDGVTVLDSLSFGAQSTDISFGRLPNGGENWIYMSKPTPGESNTASINLSLKVFLEGPFNGSEMNTDLTGLTDFPLSQPYNTEPWNYPGEESVVEIPNQDIVDWVLVELRDAPEPALATESSVRAKRAGFIRNDGSVTDTSGSNNLTFDIYYSDSLYVVLKHRNHLGVMSGSAITGAGSIFSYDFTTDSLKAYGGATGHKQILPEIWGMFAGDGDANNEVEDKDKINIWEPQSGNSGYMPGDYNLDSQTDNSDKNNYWMPNLGSGSMVPE